MSIVVPSSALPPGPPRIDGEQVPQGEQDAVLHLNGLLACLGHYECQFRNAVAFFDLCRGEPTGPSAKIDITNIPIPRFPIIEQPANTLRAWEHMASRDGAMAIYHFGQALAAISHQLRRCPTIGAQVDYRSFRLARKDFKAHFPSHDAIRHAVGHAVDFSTTIAKRETHSIKPPWKRTFGNVTIQALGSKPMRFADSLHDRAYCVTYKGHVHCYEVTVETLNALARVRERTYAVFDAAADPEFYRCPHCGGRNLSEVYSRRIYRCTDCNQPVTDEMMEVWRYRRHRAAARSALLVLLRARLQELTRAAA
jgi:hypothetical protein